MSILGHQRAHVFLSIIVVWMCVVPGAGANLRGSITSAGGEMPWQAKNVATGWSLGQSSLSIHMRLGSNVVVRAGWWDTWRLLAPPPAPVITSPVVVAGGETGWWETTEERVTIAGRRVSAHVYPFSFAIYAEPETRVVETSEEEWTHTVNVEPGNSVVLTYYSSNNYARSRENTALKVDVVPEACWGLIVAACAWLGARWRRRRNAVVLSVVAMAVAHELAAGTVMMNYQGVIEMDGGAYHGDGFFKFAIREQGSTSNLWSNDGTPGGEPIVSVRVHMTNGAFRVVIGGYEMMPLYDSIFMEEKVLRLYVWFGRTSHGPFELVADGEHLYTVPYAANARAVGGMTAGALVTQTVVAVSNSFAQDLSRYLTIAAATNLFLLKSGDTCTGTLRVRDLEVDTDITVSGGDVMLNDGRRVYFNASRTAYMAMTTNGTLAIYSREQPALEFE